jgi:hypothetical protein
MDQLVYLYLVFHHYLTEVSRATSSVLVLGSGERRLGACVRLVALLECMDLLLYPILVNYLYLMVGSLATRTAHVLDLEGSRLGGCARLVAFKKDVV